MIRLACLALAALALALAAPGAALAGSPLDEARHFARGADPANGKLLYLAGYNLKVERAQFLGGPRWLQTQGGSCASCHGPTGRGGMYPPQCDLSTPAVDFATLAGARADAPRPGTPYTADGLRRALEGARDPDGGALDPCMPKWYFSDNDFRDLLGHLLLLGGR